MSDPSNVEVWGMAISRHATLDRRIIFRFAKHLKESFDRASQPYRIIIVWRYESDGGQPVAEEHRQMNVMEDAVESILKQENFATLALVSTGEGLREWTYYAKSEDEFFERFNLGLTGLPPFPIEIHTAEDPTWSTYENFKAGVKETVN